MQSAWKPKKTKTRLLAGVFRGFWLKKHAEWRVFSPVNSIDPAIKYDESTYQKYPVPAKAGIQFR
jgi:hypothetical protein